jgi:DNA end-binding protein Ku
MAVNGKKGPSGGSNLTLGFGLVSVPVKMKPLIEAKVRTSGRMLDPDKRRPVKTAYRTEDGKILDEGVRPITGYEVPGAPGTFVVLEEGVLDGLAEERTGRVEITGTVDVNELDGVYLGKPYLLWPQDGGQQGFDLLTAALRETGLAAIATTVMTKQTVRLAFRWSDELQALVGQVLTFASHLRWNDVATVRELAGEVKETEAAMAVTLLQSLPSGFDAGEVDDAYSVALDEAIAAAAAGVKPTARKAAAKAEPAGDLMAALQASVEAAAGKKPAAKKSRKKVTA